MCEFVEGKSVVHLSEIKHQFVVTVVRGIRPLPLAVLCPIFICLQNKLRLLSDFRH